MNIKKGDIVKILVGKDKGKTGKVLKAIPKDGRVVVEGANMAKKHMRPKREGEKGEIIEFARSIHISNVQKTGEDKKPKEKHRK
ncbi:MAG: 50S ribosomal protein L24 [Nanoarchaeota archaeon]|nr:50S ribosomal protein L24 [Nanoarchaeota archaeon]